MDSLISKDDVLDTRQLMFCIFSMEYYNFLSSPKFAFYEITLKEKLINCL